MRTETRQSILVTIGTATTAVISLLYAIHAGRVLGRAEYADFAAAVALSALLCLALGPINQTVARFAAQYAARGEQGKVRTLAREIGRRVAVAGAVGLAIAAVVAKPVADLLQIRSVMTVVVAFSLVYVTLLLSIPRGVLRGLQSYVQYNVNIVAESFVRILAGVALLIVARSAALGVAGYVVGVGAALLVSFFQLREHWAGHEPQPVDGLAIRRFAWPMFLLALGAGGFLYVDVLFVKHFFDRSEAGLYGAAATLAGSISVVVTPFHIILLPLLTALQERGARIKGTFIRICLNLVVIAGAIIVLFALCPQWVMSRLYGPEFVDAAPYLAWITAARFLTHMAGLITTVPVSRSDFRFLWIYLGGLAAEVLTVLLWHDTLKETIIGVVVVQTLTLAILVLFIFMRRASRR